MKTKRKLREDKIARVNMKNTLGDLHVKIHIKLT